MGSTKLFWLATPMPGRGMDLCMAIFVAALTLAFAPDCVVLSIPPISPICNACLLASSYFASTSSPSRVKGTSQFNQFCVSIPAALCSAWLSKPRWRLPLLPSRQVVMGINELATSPKAGPWTEFFDQAMLRRKESATHKKLETSYKTRYER
jgi:hypothetical protein